jgi:hypothetical protein
MADNSNDPEMQNQDVIQAARGIRRSPAQLAALMAPPTVAMAEDLQGGALKSTVCGNRATPSACRKPAQAWPESGHPYATVGDEGPDRRGI